MYGQMIGLFIHCVIGLLPIKSVKLSSHSDTSMRAITVKNILLIPF